MLNLAYISQDGLSRSCALWYAHSTDFRIYYLSSFETNHGKVLRNGASVSFTINRDDQDWREIQGVQGQGRVDLVEDEGWDIFSKKYPFILQQFPDLEAALEKTKIWKLTPTWVRLIDNTKGFGYKEEREFEWT